jgi:hypothetical protein
MTAFEKIVAANWTQHELDNATIRETSAFVTDAVDSITSYVASVGDVRINREWYFS